MYAIVLVIFLFVVSHTHGVSWNGNWALGCDFRGNDLSNTKTRGEDCGGLCASTKGMYYNFHRLTNFLIFLKFLLIL